MNVLEMDRRQLKEVHAVLKGMIREAAAGYAWDWTAGICRNLHRRLIRSDGYLIVQRLSPSWPFCKDPQGSWPIPYNDDGCPTWEGEQLAYRLSLMRYMLKRVRDMIRRTPEVQS